ncbi:VOC family protein [Nocardia takedensis]|uniref:VOC family protein n=1 Tax=Nocardia takedensis TaxID=259390 RepID=UPI000A01045D
MRDCPHGRRRTHPRRGVAGRRNPRLALPARRNRRLRAALDAGGVLVSDAAARAFWILADAEGNEVCVCTWEDRDPA